MSLNVLPANAGIHLRRGSKCMDSRLRGNDIEVVGNVAHGADRQVRCDPPLQSPSQRAGSIRAGGGNCLTEPGIVCFPVASRPERGIIFGSNDGKTLRGR